MRPLFPTLATVNWRPSLPPDPPSGVMSHRSASDSFLARRSSLCSSWLRRSVAGSKDVGPAPLDDIRTLVSADLDPVRSPSLAKPGGVLRNLMSRGALGDWGFLKDGPRCGWLSWGRRTVGGRLPGGDCMGSSRAASMASVPTARCAVARCFCCGPRHLKSVGKCFVLRAAADEGGTGGLRCGYDDEGSGRHVRGFPAGAERVIVGLLWLCDRVKETMTAGTVLQV